MLDTVHCGIRLPYTKLVKQQAIIHRPLHCYSRTHDLQFIMQSRPSYRSHLGREWPIPETQYGCWHGKANVHDFYRRATFMNRAYSLEIVIAISQSPDCVTVNQFRPIPRQRHRSSSSPKLSFSRYINILVVIVSRLHTRHVVIAVDVPEQALVCRRAHGCAAV